MKSNSYKIPAGCSTVRVEADPENNTLNIVFVPDEPLKFFCEETECLESAPNIGDIAVFWNDDRTSAVISATKDCESSNGGIVYTTNAGASFVNAIRFRDKQQYLSVLGLY